MLVVRCVFCSGRGHLGKSQGDQGAGYNSQYNKDICCLQEKADQHATNIILLPLPQFIEPITKNRYK